MTVAQRGETERPVLACVLLVADPDERRLEEADDESEHLLSRQSSPAKVAIGPAADPGQCPGELDQTAVLRLVSHLAPARVVSVLLAAASVATDGLDVATLDRRDPDVGPCRWDGQRLEPSDPIWIDDAAAIGADVAEPAPRRSSANSGHRVADIAQPGLLGGRLRVVDFEGHLEGAMGNRRANDLSR